VPGPWDCQGRRESRPNYQTGAAAYDPWTAELQAGWADAGGNSYNAACYAEGRRFAREFLERVARRNLPSPGRSLPPFRSAPPLAARAGTVRRRQYCRHPVRAGSRSRSAEDAIRRATRAPGARD